jgi:hypothetical protein
MRDAKFLGFVAFIALIVVAIVMVLLGLHELFDNGLWGATALRVFRFANFVAGLIAFSILAVLAWNNWVSSKKKGTRIFFIVMMIVLIVFMAIGTFSVF